MKKPPLGLLLTASMIASTIAHADQPPCPGVISGKSSPSDVESFYAARATDIVRAALTNDDAQLSKLVDPRATFEVWQGDSVRMPRQIGIPAVIEIVRLLKPTGVQAAIPLYGPIYIAAPPETEPKCAWNATLLLRSEDSARGFEVQFDFVNGRLARALGHEVIITESSVR